MSSPEEFSVYGLTSITVILELHSLPCVNPSREVHLPARGRSHFNGRNPPSADPLIDRLSG